MLLSFSSAKSATTTTNTDKALSHNYNYLRFWSLINLLFHISDLFLTDAPSGRQTKKVWSIFVYLGRGSRKALHK